ncbi:MAG: hypothetical protein AAF657_02305 [Acidobacteriota bacterium]
MIMWALERHDWSKLRAAGTVVRVPRAICALRDAQSADEAAAAYWKIDNKVVVQGALYEAAVPAAECALAALPHSTEFGKPKLVELLYQLGNGESHPSEVEVGLPNLGELCRIEICRGATMIFHLLETAEPDWLDLAVDLALLMVDQAPELSGKMRWYMERILCREIDEGVRTLISEWLEENPQLR